MPDKYQFVKLEVSDYVATITLDRPPVNALSMGLYRDIASAFNEVSKRDDVRVAIVTGAGRCFCGGRDLKLADTDPPEERSTVVKAAFYAVYHCEVPVIAAVNGPALGAGFAIVTLCDIILASEKAIFGKPEIDAGVNPSIKHLSRGLNQYQARKLGFLGARIPAQELYRLGMVEQVLSPDELLPAARKMASVIAAKSPLIMRLAKKSANQVEPMPDFEEAYNSYESRVTVGLFQTEDSHEAGRSVIEKRPPKFRGR
ncbi:MAG: enoyl-CoA hydratase/isomerase family protein [Chloroflexi bacterium]|nr:enoyl-CoA hydratase/isomerase family protein [Chloroflexota bacterium]